MKLLSAMMPGHLDEILVIEQSVHVHPWTRGNFTDALNCNYQCTVLYDTAESEQLLGYAVMMPIVDEIHLLNISIAAAQQKRGLGRYLLGELMQLARAMTMRRMLLEVRLSHQIALALYRKC
jgi:ribosomal-protein-alanine N-acetyltransferase